MAAWIRYRCGPRHRYLGRQRMRASPVVLANASQVQVAGHVPTWLVLPGGLQGRQRTVRITPDRIAHIRQRRPAWLQFRLGYMPAVLERPDFIGQRAHGDRRRTEFVRLVGRPARWLLVSVKFVDDADEAWVNSAHPIASRYLTRRRRARTMWEARGPRGRKGRRHHP